MRLMQRAHVQVIVGRLLTSRSEKVAIITIDQGALDRHHDLPHCDQQPVIKWNLIGNRGNHHDS